MKKYTCYTDLDEKIKADGAPEGSKKEVLEWMQGHFGTLASPEDLVTAATFFYEGDCDEYLYEGAKRVYLAEILHEEA